ncbi:PREDICTED: N-terminal kinase-like protein isoform X1 [Vollenhovia emeryi]|uniref:N-terminal kinase-like protein isoform X1 n=1 Tax=Vollenhovia emeryi TaxID=411798 RepID=UPI0005F3AED9|nr:PREDICTED: N-terminal kinase-like protein isoform X1 [Vollenhovia emeryi]XP_011882157.1 PREDICTED: N-terminal kinase-like protein isoform X1 [Vollenhovia emeryi]XP_011882158.1 PREDICTED: N-terminal kinase-like protein isoform X1 [Vollenhovia emeryi]XP_011882159.1 PREDICTED: N-terminal kinase-like protein isoform X1 [Vollenhovia emeryi]XP_011882161.1 PREDICTED: N-terminal kinase-like protein isoform X1 [Vollenhovia emeryi]XP_011882162.1 PREDICTED: N-terminal kinase-like protein isoform X1 [V
MWSFFSRDPAKDFPYDIGEPIPGLETKSIWTIHRAKRKGTAAAGEDVSVFVFDVKNGGEQQLDIARSAVKRLKTLRHPSILAYLDSLETDKMVYLATERVEPLYNRLTQRCNPENESKKELYFSWGIFQITRALNFLNNDGNLRHNNVNLWSVFVNEESGEWKLGGVEYMTAVDTPYNFLPSTFQVYQPPEAKEGAKPATKCSVDMWGLGCLIWETYNGTVSATSQLKIPGQIPKQIITVYRELIGINPEGRPNPADVIARCRSNGGFFKNNLVDALLFLEEIQMKERGEKGRFFSQLAAQLDSFPDGVGRYKILPQLLAAFEFGDAGSAVLPPLLQLGSQLPDAEYQRRVVPCVVKLFASNDRATRLRLLQQLDRFVDHLQSATVNEAIFPQVARGFLDTNPAIREETIRSVVHLAPKLDYNNLNVETLRYFAKLQSKDEQGGIRTNTTVCLGKIAQHLHPQIRQKVLIGAFIRGTRDSFPPARIASILALAATQQYFLLQEVANRILPALCPLTTDVDKGVRENAFRVIRGFLSKLETVSEDPGLRESMEADVNTATPSLSNAAATWAGWAVTAVTAKFYRSQSDTPKSSNAHNTSRILLNKPASLEQASSSQSSASTTATTSSATSMTSLDPDHEHDTQNTQNTNSDCDWDCWDADNWGDMEQQTTATPSVPLNPASNLSPSGHSPKANEQWTSLEEEPEEETTQGVQDKNDTSEVGWEDSEFQSFDDIQPLEQPSVPSGNNKYEEAKRKREERKLARQRQMEAKRAVKLRANPAVKKI